MPDSAADHRWLHRFAVLTAIVTLALLGVGGLVTSHGVGMAVPDWPNTYGYNLFQFPVSQWIGGILYEHSHRLVAVLVGFLTTILAVWVWVRETRGRNRWLGVAAIVTVVVLMGLRELPVYVALAGAMVGVIVAGLWRSKKNPGALRWLGVVALAAVILQGVLGGLRVVWLKDEIGIFHATLAQLFFLLICVIALLTSRWWKGWAGSPLPADGAHGVLGPTKKNLWRLPLTAAVLIFFQLILGATMRHQHAGLAIPDFPLAYGQLWPDMSAEAVTRYNQQRMEVTALNGITALQIGMQMAHRITAAVIFAAVALCVWSAKRRLGWQDSSTKLALTLLVLVLSQGFLGAATIWSNKAADIATAHVVVGALSLMTGAMITLITFRRGLPIQAAAKASVLAEASDSSFAAKPAPKTT